jgi:hypothetical protein
MFDEKFANINSSDKSMFAEVINHLLVHSFIVRDVFDTKEKIIKINPYYRFVERHYDLLNDYLGFIGYSIEKDILLGVISLYNSYTENKIKVDRETSLIIYVLRLIYENEKSETSQTNQGVYITTPTLIKTMLDFNIQFANKRLTGRSIAKSLRFLVQHNIINKVSGSYDDGNVSFYILPSICYAIDSLKINAIASAIDRINNEYNKVDTSALSGGDF